MNKRIRKKKQKLACTKTEKVNHMVSEIESKGLQVQIAEYKDLTEEKKALMKEIVTTGRKNGVALITIDEKVLFIKDNKL